MCSNTEVDAPYRVKAVQIQYTRLGKKKILCLVLLVTQDFFHKKKTHNVGNVSWRIVENQETNA